MPYDFRSTPLDTDVDIAYAVTGTFRDDEGSLLGFSGWDWNMQGRRAYGAADPPLFELTVGGGLTVGSGTVAILIPDSTLAAIAAGRYVWELRGENGSGDGEITIKGPWTHHAGVVS